MINNITGENVNNVLINDVAQLHMYGPIDDKLMEEIAYCKVYFPDVFSKYEKKILYTMGMFYKTDNPESLLEKAIDIYREEINDKYGHYYTPDQSLMRKNIEEALYYSFSAPTSSGKSHVFRDIIREAQNDIVVIVPSRALISEYYHTVIKMVSNEVLVMTFVDNINKLKTKRRIFILTPERAGELFKRKNEFNIELFLFDEAQITEEKIRGTRFDALVRRVIREFPDAKKVFAHPFIENPDIHFGKHNIQDNNRINKFMEKTVGQLFYYIDNNHYYLYSPYEKAKRNSPVRQDDNLIEKVLSSNGTILIYLAKTKIYDLRFLQEFDGIISKLPEISNPNALDLIEKLRNYLGAGKTLRGKRSLLIELMKKGIVLHHGSIPLKGRLIIEEFIKNEYARVCFATSTLLRGINMPFDVVFIDKFQQLTPLDFKNLIGRAGRTNEDNILNIGSIVCSKNNVNKIIQRIGEICILDESNNIDAPLDSFEDDSKDLVEAIQNNDFIDELNIPKNQYERLQKNTTINDVVKNLIELLIPNGYPITGDEYTNLDKKQRNEIKKCFSTLYIASLRNPKMTTAESAVISTSLQILLWKIQGKSFKQTVQLRYNYITRRKEQLELLKDLRNKRITDETFKSEMEKLTLLYTQTAFSIPNKHMGTFPLFPGNTPINKCDYDRLVYDTYDYLDKVISLSLVDPINAALEIYYLDTQDLRAKALQNYIRYGTNSQFEILLTRYGFDFEDSDWLVPCIDNISEDGIDFNQGIHSLTNEQYELIERYL